MTFTQKYLLIGLTKKLFSLTKFFFVKPSATMAILYLPFIPCVMERKNDCFFVCRIAQVSQGKHWDSFAKKNCQCP
jgi:hypothetical protein